MALSTQTQAVVLLTAYLSKPGKGDPKPLSPNEWGRFAVWLKHHSLQPESLLSDPPERLLAGWQDQAVTVPRIEALLSRGGALGLALEKWQRAGLWVMTRSDPDYPDRLKQRLRADAPPLLFGCGNRYLLGNGGLAVVGSRDATAADLAFAATLGMEASAQGMSIVSGGARGIDEAAMLGALEREGTTIGVLADNLLRNATSAKYRKPLIAGDLVLVSPFNPEAAFAVGNAMARNRYVYCLADAAVVVSSRRDQGGTWTGAIENLKHGWVPLWVKPSVDPVSGNEELLRRGAHRLPDGQKDLASLIQPAVLTADGAISGSEPPATRPHLPFPPMARREESVKEGPPAQPPSSYDLFLLSMRDLTATAPLTLEQLQPRLDLTRRQLNVWLKRGVAEGRIYRLTKPVRYRWQATPPRQPSIFDDDDRGG